MTSSLKNLIHGRESYIVYFGSELIMKRPLPTLSDSARKDWLAKQHRTKDAIDEIYAVGNPRYNIPRMIHIKDDEFQLLEECAPGRPLTADLYNTLTSRQQYEIIDGIASFLVDMNELKPIKEIERHKIISELKFERLNKFIDTKMQKWFHQEDVKYMEKLSHTMAKFEYNTRAAWSHCDLNPGNVLYDPATSTLSFIDFAEANYRFIYRDIFAPLQIELGICNRVYETYYKLHNNIEYTMPDPNNENLRQIMKYRIICALLKRFIKASDDLRLNPSNEKSIENNRNKILFMQQQIQSIRDIYNQFSK